MGSFAKNVIAINFGVLHVKSRETFLNLILIENLRTVGTFPGLLSHSPYPLSIFFLLEGPYPLSIFFLL
jgi:hypothetical protein